VQLSLGSLGAGLSVVLVCRIARFERPVPADAARQVVVDGVDRLRHDREHRAQVLGSERVGRKPQVRHHPVSDQHELEEALVAVQDRHLERRAVLVRDAVHHAAEQLDRRQLLGDAHEHEGASADHRNVVVLVVERRVPEERRQRPVDQLDEMVAVVRENRGRLDVRLRRPGTGGDTEIRFGVRVETAGRQEGGVGHPEDVAQRASRHHGQPVGVRALDVQEEVRRSLARVLVVLVGGGLVPPQTGDHA
jgi:hypothetical protein